MDTDTIVIGSGLAGLNAALLAAAQGSVCLVTKAALDDANTTRAQGGIAGALAPDDSPSLHAADTIEAGAGLCDAGAVAVLTHDGPTAVRRLLALGVPFDRSGNEVHLAREGAHSLARVLHAGGDRTGAAIEQTLIARLHEKGVTIREHTLVTDLAVETGRCVGARVVGQSSAEEAIAARRTLLASGGAGNLYRISTNPSVATGDGVALAFSAGAVVRDMEFVQFHPTALRLPGRAAFLITEAMRGEGAVLHSVDGQRFMPAVHPDAELAPRDVVARAIVVEMQRTGADHVLLDISHREADFIATRFPGVYAHCLEACGIDITLDALPVAPAAHYLMGGIFTDLDARTTLPGLLACGEVASTGAHGANRIASNSLLEAAVFSERAIAADAVAPCGDGAPVPADTIDLPIGVHHAAPDLRALQTVLWDTAGLERDVESLAYAAAILDGWSLPGSPALTLATTTARLIVEGALRREESRGAHFRRDFPEPSPAWQRHLAFRQAQE